MQWSLSYRGSAGGVGVAEYMAFLSLSIQELEESDHVPAPPVPHPGRAEGSRSGRAPGPWVKVFSHAVTVFLVLVLCIGLFVGYGLVNNRWYHVLAVDGGSMRPAIGWGDLIVITKPPKQLEPGMIVTMQVKNKIVTHRVLQVDPLVTQGDANGTPDTWKTDDVRVVGVVRFWIPKLGGLLGKARLPGFASGAWFRTSKVLPAEAGAGEWEIAQQEPTEAAAASSDLPLTGEVDTDSSEVLPPPDTQGPFVAEPTSATTTTTETPLDPTQESLETPPPTVVDGGTETTSPPEETAPVQAGELLGAGAAPLFLEVASSTPNGEVMLRIGLVALP